LDSWRRNRREDGWRQNRLTIIMEGYEDEADPALGQSAVLPPLTVKAAKRLAEDLRVLTMLTDLEVPPLRRLRGSSKLKVLHGFGESSGNSFGWSLDFDEDIRYEHGLWSETLCEEHSNTKELRNLVNALMRAGLEGRLTGRDIFLYTDNQVAKRSYYRGTAASQSVFELLVELYILQMKYDIILHVIWIDGTRIIQQGIDDLSRGGGAGLATQVLAMRGEVPLSQGALERNVLLEPWIRSWLGGEGLVTLTPEGWFSDARSQGSFYGRPAAAAAAVDQLCDAVHKRPCCSHVFVCLLIMTYLWINQLLKACAFRFTMKSVCDIWPYTEHESLGFFIVLPLSRHEPWNLRGTDPVVDLEAALREVPEDDYVSKGHIVRKFLLFTRRLECLSEGMVRGVLHTQSRG
jgi:hypothetical protein